MSCFGKETTWFLPVCGIVSFLANGLCYSNDCDLDEQGLRYCNITVGLADSGHIVSPGTAEFGHYNTNISHNWLIMIENSSSQQLYVCPAYLDLYVGDIINFFDVAEVLPDHNVTSLVPEKTYWGEAMVAGERHRVEQLLNLSCITSDTGMLYLSFMPTVSDVGFVYFADGFDFIYFAKSKIPDFPINHETIQATDFMQQIDIPISTEQFTIEAAEAERIWLQVIYMNLTSSALEILYSGDCKTNPNRLEITDSRFVLDLVGNPEARFSRIAAHILFTANCSSGDCLLASLCRNPFNMSPVTLITEGNIAHVRVFCHQQSAKDGAIINYKIFNPLQDQGSCPLDGNAEYTILDQHYNNLAHSFDFISASQESYTWWLENINNNETQISVTENTLGLSPDCVSERVEIYNGKCINPENLVTYFCGGIRETYRLTSSPYVTVRFTGRAYAAKVQQKRFNLLINAGPSRSGQPESSDNAQAGHSALLTVFLPIILFAVLICLPVVVKVTSKSKHKSTISPLVEQEYYDADNEDESDPDTTGKQEKSDKVAPRHRKSKSLMTSRSSHGAEAQGEDKQTLGLPQFPKTLSALSLAPSPSPFPSITSLADPSVHPSLTMLGIGTEAGIVESNLDLEPSMTALGISVDGDTLDITRSTPALQQSMTMLGITVDEDKLGTTSTEPKMQPSMTMLGITVDDTLEQTSSEPHIQPSMTMLGITMNAENTLEPQSSEPHIQPSMTMLGITMDAENTLEPTPSEPHIQPSMTMLGINVDDASNTLEPTSSEPHIQPSMTMLGITVDAENTLEPTSSEPHIQPSLTMLGITVDAKETLEPTSSEPRIQPSMTMPGITVDAENTLEPTSSEPHIQPSMTMLGITVDDTSNTLKPTTSEPHFQPSMTMLGITVDAENTPEPTHSEPQIQPSLSKLGIGETENLETATLDRGFQPSITMLGIGFDGNAEEQEDTRADTGMQPSMTMLGIGIDPTSPAAEEEAAATPSHIDDITGLPILSGKDSTVKKKRRKSSVKGKGSGLLKVKKGKKK